MHPVLVTGASKGIGRATARLLADRGIGVFAGVRGEGDADALRRDSDRITPVMLDVTDRDGIAAAAERVSREAPDGLSGVVNNAGIVVPGPLEFLPLEHLRTQLEVNVVGVVAVTQAFLPLIRRGAGRIVNVSSINGRVAVPFIGPYAMSKFAVEAMSDALRMELRRWNIPVVVIEPGAIETPIWQTSQRRAARISGELGSAARDSYGGVLRAFETGSGRPPKHAIPPQRVARVIERALSARRPRTRYLVGLDAHLAALAKAVLPDRLIDRLITSRR